MLGNAFGPRRRAVPQGALRAFSIGLLVGFATQACVTDDSAARSRRGRAGDVTKERVGAPCSHGARSAWDTLVRSVATSGEATGAAPARCAP